MIKGTKFEETGSLSSILVATKLNVGDPVYFLLVTT